MMPALAAPTPLSRLNPVTKLSAGFIITAVLLVSIDLVTPLVIVAVELTLLPLTGLGVLALLRWTWPLLLAAVAVGFVNLLFAAERTGTVLLDAGPLLVTSGSLIAGIGLSLRLLGLALPGILVLAGTDPTDLADALVKHWRLSARFAYGALAAFRLLPLLAAEWEQIGLARRTRGVDAGRSPIRAVSLFAGQTLTLLIGAVRRGTRLATAMDARGFDSTAPRTFARVPVLRTRDWLVIAAAVALGAIAITISVLAGTWRPLFG